MRAMSDASLPAVWHALRRGLDFKWTTLLLILAINTGIAGLLWIDDTRPFWHPLITAHSYGVLIA
jgi:hypothetical protein